MLETILSTFPIILIGNTARESAYLEALSSALNEHDLSLIWVAGLLTCENICLVERLVTAAIVRRRSRFAIPRNLSVQNADAYQSLNKPDQLRNAEALPSIARRNAIFQQFRYFIVADRFTKVVALNGLALYRL